MAKSNYTRGDMVIEDHKETFGGFMNFSVYGGAAIIVTLMFPILVFGVNIAWPGALLATIILGVVLGIVMRFKGQWYAIVIGAAVLMAVVIGLLSFIL